MARFKFRFQGVQNRNLKFSPEHTETSEIWSTIFINDNHTLVFSADGYIFRSNQRIPASALKSAIEAVLCVSGYLPATSGSQRRGPINGQGYRNSDCRHSVVQALSSLRYDPAKWEYPRCCCTRTRRCAKRRSFPDASIGNAVVLLLMGPWRWTFQPSSAPQLPGGIGKIVLKLLFLRLRTKESSLWAAVIKSSMQRNRR